MLPGQAGDLSQIAETERNPHTSRLRIKTANSEIENVPTSVNLFQPANGVTVLAVYK